MILKSHHKLHHDLQIPIIPTLASHTYNEFHSSTHDHINPPSPIQILFYYAR